MTLEARWDRSLFDVSSRLADPFCWVLEGIYRMISPLDPKKFYNCSSSTQEFAYRAFCGCLGIVVAVKGGIMIPIWVLTGTVVLGLACKVSRAAAIALQKNGYTYVKGRAIEKIDLSEIKVMSWNVLGLAGGLSLSHGGNLHWRERIDKIVEKIKAEKPDVLVLQEIFDTALCEALIEKLSAEFSHIYAHLGTSIWGSEGGCMVLTRCPVQSFSNTPFANNDWKIERSFAILEIGNIERQYRIIGTHLHSGYSDADKKKRREQFDQMMNSLSKLPPKPTLVVGDLNIGRNEQEGDFLKEFLEHGYTGSEETCTNMLDKQWKSCTIHDHEMVDYISQVKNTGKLKAKDSHLVRAFDATYNTKTALSDHHGLVVTYTST